jgi:hypothetical protein
VCTRYYRSRGWGFTLPVSRKVWPQAQGKAQAAKSLPVAAVRVLRSLCPSDLNRRFTYLSTGVRDYRLINSGLWLHWQETWMILEQWVKVKLCEVSNATLRNLGLYGSQWGEAMGGLQGWRDGFGRRML